MRLVVWNIRYGAGIGKAMHWPFPGIGYLRRNDDNRERIAAYLAGLDPDIVGLLEVDGGSIRAGLDQAKAIADALGHYSVYRCKYGPASLGLHLPIVSKQGNAFLAAPRVLGERFHYFSRGTKRLVIELELEGVAIFLVHLSLRTHHRRHQLDHLRELIGPVTNPAMVVGDFNTFGGAEELSHFREALGLRSANTQGLRTYPSHKPKRELDYILHDERIVIEHFAVGDSLASDHLPMICDFQLPRPPA
ncbi:MAG: endonuclease/exonuclease/phosphatase family protein [Pseudomonadota bacterium]